MRIMCCLHRMVPVAWAYTKPKVQRSCMYTSKKHGLFGMSTRHLKFTKFVSAVWYFKQHYQYTLFSFDICTGVAILNYSSAGHNCYWWNWKYLISSLIRLPNPTSKSYWKIRLFFLAIIRHKSSFHRRCTSLRFKIIFLYVATFADYNVIETK